VSASESTWPDWLRSRTAVELLGPPRLFFAWLTIALSLLVIVYAGAWNAAKYPIVLGYDAQPNAAYAHVLLDQHHIPRFDQSQESKQPPGYYFVAGIAARVGLHWPFNWREARPFSAQLPEASYRGAQILNVVLDVATALVLLLLVRMVAPRRPEVWAAAIAFFAFLPVVPKTAAMFHPETMNMFCSALALLFATRIARERRFMLWSSIGLALSLLAGFFVRPSTLFTLIAVTLGLAFAFGRHTLSRRTVVVALSVLVVLLACGLVLAERSPDIRRSFTSQTSTPTRSNFARLDLGTMFHSPYRPNMLNEALPVTYLEIWGDWIGAFAWAPFEGEPSTAALHVLRDQTWIGIIPTLLAIGGWIILAFKALRRRPELAVLAALPLIAVGGYLFRSYQLLVSDGDLFKASYLLTTAPVWAIGFGLAFAALGRNRIVQATIGTCLVIFAVLELRFMMFGLQAGRSIF
jgi:hypothetical protein